MWTRADLKTRAKFAFHNEIIGQQCLVAFVMTIFECSWKWQAMRQRAYPMDIIPEEVQKQLHFHW